MSAMKRIVAKTHKAFFPSKHNDFQPYILRPKNLFILAVILVVIKFLIFSWFLYYPQITEFAVVTSSELIEMANNERVANGLEPLNINDKLIQAAQNKAQDMIENSYFAHTSPLGTSPWYWFDKAGYNYIAAGENLAKDFTDSKYLHKAWMKSPSHRDNILNEKYQEIGIAVIEGKINGKDTVVAVQLFGRLASGKKVEEKPGIKQPASPEITPITQNQETPSPSVGIGGATEEKTGQQVTNNRESGNILNTISEKSDSAVNKIYFIIAGLLMLVLSLTIFVNFRVQYPKLIFASIIIIILIIGIASFNGQEFLNRGIDII
jgi:hypothetical protein